MAAGVSTIWLRSQFGRVEGPPNRVLGGGFRGQADSAGEREAEGLLPWQSSVPGLGRQKLKVGSQPWEPVQARRVSQSCGLHW